MNDINVSFINVTPELAEANVTEFCQSVLALMQVDNWEVSIVFCNDDFIRTLNRDYKAKDEPTDVLSFSQSQPTDLKLNLSHDKYLAGDIVISLDTVKKNAPFWRVSMDEELKRLLIHGLLHLQGFEHAGSVITGVITGDVPGCEATSEMLQIQEKILNQLKGRPVII